MRSILGGRVEIHITKRFSTPMKTLRESGRKGDKALFPAIFRNFLSGGGEGRGTDRRSESTG